MVWKQWESEEFLFKTKQVFKSYACGGKLGTYICIYFLILK